MKTFYVALLAVTAIGCVFLDACSKKNNDNSQSSRLNGRWRLVKTATDDNANGAIDASEIHAVQQGYVDYLLFNNDSTGSETTQTNLDTVVLPFRWYFTLQDSLQRDGVGHDTIRYFIANINTSTMQLYTNTQFGVAAYYYNRN
jgi:hypothetical protein